MILGEFYNNLSGLPRAPNPDIPAPLLDAPEGCCRCACRKKFIRVTDIRYHHTGLIVASDTECPECLPSHKDFALIVCLECKAVVAKTAPKKFDGGFELKGNVCYHVAKCSNCCPGLKVSHLLEKYNWDKARGYPVPDIDAVLPRKDKK